MSYKQQVPGPAEGIRYIGTIRVRCNNSARIAGIQVADADPKPVVLGCGGEIEEVAAIRHELGPAVSGFPAPGINPGCRSAPSTGSRNTVQRSERPRSKYDIP